jgi:hypothetical protein
LTSNSVTEGSEMADGMVGTWSDCVGSTVVCAPVVVCKPAGTLNKMKEILPEHPRVVLTGPIELAERLAAFPRPLFAALSWALRSFVN